MITIVYFGLTLIIALVDSFFKSSSFYLVTNVILRICILFPLILVIVRGQSRYANVLRKTLWCVMLADALLPIYFPAGMAVFLVVQLLNCYNFYQHIEVSQEKLSSLLFPGIVAFATALSLYFFVLLPSLEPLFKILVGVFLFPLSLAWSLSLTNYIQHKTKWALLTSIGMSLFFFTDFQVAFELLTKYHIPLYGFLNAFTYYIGLYLMSQPTEALGPMSAPRNDSFAPQPA